LGAVKYTQHGDFVPLKVHFVHDDIRESLHDPLSGAGDESGMPDVRELDQPFGSVTNTLDYTPRGLRVPAFDE
jgi:hypothetical protein